MAAITREEYFANAVPEKEGSEVYETVYRVKSGVLVRELELDAGLGENSAEIAMITDMHIRKEREDIYNAVTNAMECASFSDLVVLCGDNIESISDTAHIDILKETVWNPYPDTICVVGNHDQFYGDPVENRKVLDSIWPHDPYCYSRILNKKLMVLAIDDNTGSFNDDQCVNVEKELKYARENELAVLVFLHIAFHGINMEIEANQKMYDIVRKNADIVKATFSGHNHVDYYSTLEGSYVDADGNVIEKAIPNYKLQANSEPDFTGNVLLIKVK